MSEPRAISPRSCAATALLLCALWLFDPLVLGSAVLTPFVALGESLPALSPLYAFWLPALSPRALGFAAAALALVASAARLMEPERTSRAVFVPALLVFAAILPLTLFATRQALPELGGELAIYADEEIYFDSLRIREYLPFLAHYVELMPDLSLHGRHFPPGLASFLYAVRAVFGGGLHPAAIAMLACFVLAIGVAYAALVRIGPETSARAGALLLLASPSLLDFACTSTDAVFLLFASAAWWVAAGVVGTLERGTPPSRAQRFAAPLLTGVTLFVATCFSFSAIPLGLAVGLAIAISGQGSLRASSEALALVGTGFALSAVALFAGTGFALWDCLAEARRSNLAFMSGVVGRDARELYGVISYGNAAAFLIGAGVALVTAASTGLAKWRRPWTLAFLLTLAVMSFGGLYFMETERIWLFAMPWLVAIADPARIAAPASLRLLLALGCTQAFVMETLLFTLW